MSLAHLNQESRNELERRVLSAALKLSLLKGDKTGAKLAHQCLAGLLKIEKRPQQAAVGLTTTTEQVAFTDEPDAPVTVDSSDVLELPELSAFPENGTVYDLSSVETEPADVISPGSAPERASDNKSEAENTIAQLQKIGERAPKPSPHIDFELPPDEKAKMKAASIKPPKAAKPSAQPAQTAKNDEAIELTATAENQTIYGTEGEQTIAGIVLPPFLTEPQIGLQYHALYKMLGVRQTATRDDIHKTFLRLVRRIMRELKGAKRPSRQELLGYLRKVWIAHDILTDPNTRTDYDFRDLGLRGADTEAPSESPSKPASTQMLLRIGELLQVAGLLETAELEIACDMHKAMPEMMFGTFLVRQGFIAEVELESVLFGQKALRTGAISVAQFQVAMELSREKSLPVKEALIEKGFATQAQLDELDQQAENGSAPVTSIEATIDSARIAVASEESVPVSKNNPPAAINENSSLESIEERLAVAQPLQISKAAPSWKDQLDWSSPADEDASSVEVKQDVAQPSATLEVAPDAIPELPEQEQLLEVVETIEVAQEKNIEDEPAVASKRETTVTEHEPGLFSHMREAASFYDAEDDFFTHYNFAQPESETIKTDDSTAENDLPVETTDSQSELDSSEDLETVEEQIQESPSEEDPIVAAVPIAEDLVEQDEDEEKNSESESETSETNGHKLPVEVESTDEVEPNSKTEPEAEAEIEVEVEIEAETERVVEEVSTTNESSSAGAITADGIQSAEEKDDDEEEDDDAENGTDSASDTASGDSTSGETDSAQLESSEDTSPNDEKLNEKPKEKSEEKSDEDLDAEDKDEDEEKNKDDEDYDDRYAEYDE